jgi:hypothetical protein
LEPRLAGVAHPRKLGCKPPCGFGGRLSRARLRLELGLRGRTGQGRAGGARWRGIRVQGRRGFAGFRRPEPKPGSARRHDIARPAIGARGLAPAGGKAKGRGRAIRVCPGPGFRLRAQGAGLGLRVWRHVDGKPPGATGHLAARCSGCFGLWRPGRGHRRGQVKLWLRRNGVFILRKPLFGQVLLWGVLLCGVFLRGGVIFCGQGGDGLTQ